MSIPIILLIVTIFNIGIIILSFKNIRTNRRIVKSNEQVLYATKPPYYKIKKDITEKQREEYLNKLFSEKWDSFLDSEKKEYNLSELYYYEKASLFYFLHDRKDYVKITVTDNELKEKLIKIAECD